MDYSDVAEVLIALRAIERPREPINAPAFWPKKLRTGAREGYTTKEQNAFRHIEKMRALGLVTGSRDAANPHGTLTAKGREFMANPPPSTYASAHGLPVHPWEAAGLGSAPFRFSGRQWEGGTCECCRAHSAQIYRYWSADAREPRVCGDCTRAL